MMGMMGIVKTIHLKSKILSFRLSAVRRIIFYKDFSSYTKHFGIVEALDVFIRESKSIKSDDHIIYDYWKNQLSQGIPLEVILRPWLPDDEYLQIISSRQAVDDPSNALSNALNCALNICQQKRTIYSQLTSKCSYPILSFCLVIGSCFLFQFQLAPKLINIKPLEKWPGDAQASFQTLTFYTDNLLILLILFLASLVATYLYMVRGTGGIRNMLNIIPPFNVYQSVISFSILLSIGSLLKSNIPLITALNLIKSVSSKWVAFEIQLIIRSLETPSLKGDSSSITSEAFNSPLFDKLTRSKLMTYSTTTSFGDGFQFLNERILEITTARVAAISSIVGTCILALAFYVLFFIFQIAIKALAGDPHSSIGF